MKPISQKEAIKIAQKEGIVHFKSYQNKQILTEKQLKYYSQDYNTEGDAKLCILCRPDDDYPLSVKYYGLVLNSIDNDSAIYFADENSEEPFGSFDTSVRVEFLHKE